MPKNLNDVLKGVKKSTTSKLTTGENPGVDYADKSKDTRDFFDQHPVQKHEDRVGNGDDVYKASNVKKASMLRHGHEPKPKDIRVYDKTNQVTNEEVEELDEADLMHIKVGEKVRLTNPKASPKHTVNKIKGDKVHITKDSGEKVIMPLDRIKRIKAQAMKLKEDKDDREYDYEGEMAVTKLKTICRACEHLIKMMKPNTNLPEWVQAKIIKAEDYITTAHDYLMSEMNEETELSEAKCNMSEAGTMCEVHGKKACSTEDDESAENKEPKFTGKKDKEGKVVLITDKKQIQEKLTKKMSNKVEEGFLDQRSKKSTRSEEASKKMAADISKRKEKLFDSDLRKQEMLFSHKLKNKIKEQSAPAETVIRMPSGEVGDTGRV